MSTAEPASEEARIPNSIPLICHWRGDEDIADAFFRYYSKYCAAFYIILHGPRQDSLALLSASEKYRIIVCDHYDEQFNEEEKVRRINCLIPQFSGQWVLVVDSDEFVEFPYSSIRSTILALEREGVSCMAAPLLQRIRLDGSIKTDGVIHDPFKEFPLCSEKLYRLMGSNGNLNKFPLFKCIAGTKVSYGNHRSPNGTRSANSIIKGVTHHFKWKSSVVNRIRYMIEIEWPWAESEAIPYLRYLERNNYTLPLRSSFKYSRRRLFHRGLLSRRG